MTFIEAAKKSNYVRRPINKHLGPDGNGWIDAKFAFDQGRNWSVVKGLDYELKIILLTWNDLMADDWEAKVD